MKPTLLISISAAGLLAALAMPARVAAQKQKAQPARYTVTDLGLASPAGQPIVIKNNGLISDSVLDASDDAWHAALWFHGTPIDLTKTGGLGGPNSLAYGVNERRQAVGEAETADLDPNLEDFCGFGDQHVCHAFIWQNGLMSALPLLKDANGVPGRNAVAKGVNILGQVAGVAENTAFDSTCPPYDPASLQYQKYQFKPVIWANGNIQELPTSGVDSSGNGFNDPDGVAFRINDRGQAVGSTGTCTGLNFSYLYGLHATLWENGSVTDLGNLGGIASAFGTGNFAYNINKPGHVVGTSGTADGSFHAFFWSPETLIQDVGTLPGDVASVGLAIDDKDDITGGSITPAGNVRAFLRPAGGTPVDLNSLIRGDSPLYLFTACSINSRGEIIGLALDAQGNFHGYLATPSNGR